MATSDEVLNVIRRNRSPYWLRRQLTQVKQDVQVVQANTLGADPALGPIGTEDPLYSDEFYGTLVSGRWSWINQGTSTASLWQDRLLLNPEVSGNPANNAVRLFMQPIAAATSAWSARTRAGFNSIVANCGGGLVAYRQNSGKFVFQSALARVAGAPFSCRLITAYWDSVATLNTVIRDDNPPLFEQRTWFIQVRYDGTNLYFDYSADNVWFFNITSVSAATALGGAPTHFGFGANAPALSPDAPDSFEWFRVYNNASLNQAPA